MMRRATKEPRGMRQNYLLVIRARNLLFGKWLSKYYLFYSMFQLLCRTTKQRALIACNLNSDKEECNNKNSLHKMIVEILLCNSMLFFLLSLDTTTQYKLTFVLHSVSWASYPIHLSSFLCWHGTLPNNGEPKIKRTNQQYFQYIIIYFLSL